MKHNPIADWLKAQGRTSDWLAKEVGCSANWLSSVGTGNKTPSPILVASLERVTGIPASAWVKA